MLALDQRSFAPKEYRAIEGPEADETYDRERIAWTYCFLFDRNIAIRTGTPLANRRGKGISALRAAYIPRTSRRESLLVSRAWPHVQR